TDNTADIVSDGRITPADAIYVINRLGDTKDNTNFLADVNNDGTINAEDVEAVIGLIGQALP
ncbi:MAG: dockerin type I domain-containing protein, partial [Chloroflexota bacterium]